MSNFNSRFLTPVLEIDSSKPIYATQDFVLQPIEYDEITTKKLMEEICKYEISIKNAYCYTYKEDNSVDKNVENITVRLDKLINMKSNKVSTEEPIGDYIIRNGEFLGVVLFLENIEGGGWNNYKDNWYCILYENGRISGDNYCNHYISDKTCKKANSFTYYLQRVR